MLHHYKLGRAEMRLQYCSSTNSDHNGVMLFFPELFFETAFFLMVKGDTRAETARCESMWHSSCLRAFRLTARGRFLRLCPELLRAQAMSCLELVTAMFFAASATMARGPMRKCVLATERSPFAAFDCFKQCERICHRAPCSTNHCGLANAES